MYCVYMYVFSDGEIAYIGRTCSLPRRIKEHLKDLFFAEPPSVYFSVCNAFKYLWRSEHKHTTPLEDIKKAKWYIDKAIELLEVKE